MPAPIVVTEEGDDSDMAATEGAGDTTDNLVTPVVPPVVPVAMDDEPVPAPAVPEELPS